MNIQDISFGDVDAKNEILKQKRNGDRGFFESYSVPNRISLDDYIKGQKYFVLGLKGTGKTALLRYLHDKLITDGAISELLLFKTHVTEEDRQQLSQGAGYEIVSTGDTPTFVQDFKEAWKWVIYQRISEKLHSSGVSCASSTRFYKLTGTSRNGFTDTLGALFAKLSSGKLKISGEALGVAIDLGLDLDSNEKSAGVSLSSVNRLCAGMLSGIKLKQPLYLLFDELELFHETPDQFDRDRRIIRDLVYAISQINSESADAGRQVFLLSSLRTEVLHSVLELGHEIGRDIDDYGEKLDWSVEKEGPNHPLLNLVSKKISVSSGVESPQIWTTFFPEKINDQKFYKFLLGSSYYRPRDIVRLLQVARSYDPSAEKFTQEHFDKTATEYSKQTWLEITEELLASYSTNEISALQRVLLGFHTHFFKRELEERIRSKYRDDTVVQNLFREKGMERVLADLYRIGVIGNDFIVQSKHKKTRRYRWIFRGNTMLNDAERIAIHKSLWKHLTLIRGTNTK